MKTTWTINALWRVAIIAALSLLTGLSFPGSPYAGEAEDILKQAQNLKNQDNDFKVEVRVRGDKESFKIGDEICFIVKATKDCYVTLIDIGPSGKPVIIFPNKWIKSNFVKAGKEYLVPPPESNYQMFADEPKGIEMVKAIASLEPIKALENADLSQAGHFRIMEKPNVVMKGIRMEVGQKKKTDWSTSEVVFSIEAPSKQQ